jgi:hypothetical protein
VTLPLLPTLALAASPATPHRVALLVGANRAPPGRSALKYAHRDAEQLRDALVRVGGVAPDDAVLLLDPRPAEVLSALHRLTEGLSHDAGETLLYFYYSGHADDAALYPGDEALSVEALRTALLADQATVRIGIIDACSGGGWTRAKGLSPAPPVDVRPPLTLASEGTVLIASSSGLEAAHESDALQGSFFTHHLVGGLLGAADTSGDGQVSATEAFQYAQAQTVRDSVRASLDPQHPSFEWNLRGRRDLTLAQLTEGRSTLSVEQTAGPLQVVELPSGLVLLELPQGERHARLAVAPGQYLIRRIDAQRVATAREVQVVAGKTLSVEERSLELVGREAPGRKGGAEVPAFEATTLPTHAVGVSVHGGAWVGSTSAPTGALRLAWAALDWLELTLVTPGASVLLGTRGEHEVLLFAGLEGVSWSTLQGFVLVAGAAAAYRHWFTPQLSGLVDVGLDVLAPFTHTTLVAPEADVAVTWSTGRFSVNLGASAASLSTQGVTVGLGSPRLGNRVLPLLQVQLTPSWSVGLDALVHRLPTNAFQGRVALCAGVTL